MPIIRCSEQTRQTLEGFYTELISSEDSTSVSMGTAMLRVLKLINETFKETTIFGLTSHYRLYLLNKDSSRSPWYISLIGIREYRITYLMPIDKQPWPNATIEGEAKSLDELKNFIIIAMTESEGWPNNSELKVLYEQVKNLRI